MTMFNPRVSVLALALLGLACNLETEAIDGPILSVENDVDRSGLGAAVCTGALGLTPVCPPGFAPFSEITGVEQWCDACVPLPGIDDVEPECYFDAECPPKWHCEVDMLACPQPPYCAGCWDGCTDEGLSCTSCIDCACGGTCVPN